MAFESILFERVPEGIREAAPAQPEFFVDLNLDQIVASATAGKDEYNLKPFFYTSLHDADAVNFRHEVMQDLERPEVAAVVEAFAQAMRTVRSNLAELQKRYYDQQMKRWLLDAAQHYVAGVKRLAQALGDAKPGSRGLRAFHEYLAQYVSAEHFVSLADQTEQLEKELAAIRYCIFINGLRVEVLPYSGNPDYGAEVEATFARFAQGDVNDYAFRFGDYPNMHDTEALILAGVVQLYPDTFSKMDAFWVAHQGFPDSVIVAFDREVQFYIAWLSYITPLKGAGLTFCYPAVSTTNKDVCDYQAIDLALANKLVADHATAVCNDFYLNTPERIIVVSGPNQGGKTTFARMFGQLHYLASLGCSIPGTRATLFLPDRIFTHFEQEEHMTNLRGKLEDDLVRIHAILEAATPRSMIIINEIFASTALQDAVLLSSKVASTIMELDILCVWVTFIDEVASLGAKTISMVSTVVPDNPAKRTFKIVRRPADGLAYAMSRAQTYGLTYQMIMERTKR